MEIMTENYCDECEDTLHAVFDREKFWKYEEGTIRCRCGCVVMPCNECGGCDADGNELNCDKCPWKGCKPKDCMTEKEYLKWEKANDPDLYKVIVDRRYGNKEFVYVCVDEDDGVREVDVVMRNLDDALFLMRETYQSYIEKHAGTKLDVKWCDGKNGVWGWYDADEPYGYYVNKEELV